MKLGKCLKDIEFKHIKSGMKLAWKPTDDSKPVLATVIDVKTAHRLIQYDVDFVNPYFQVPGSNMLVISFSNGPYKTLTHNSLHPEMIEAISRLFYCEE